MAKVLVERATLGSMLEGGLARGDVALLLRRANAGDGTSLRILSRAARAPVTMDFTPPLDEDGRPIPGWTDDPVAVATVEIGPGLGWRGGELLDPKGMIPATLATAIIGRPIGLLFTHRDVNPDAIARQPLNGGVARVTMETVALEVPRSPRARLKTLRILVNRRSVESQTTSWIKATFTTSAAMIWIALALRLAHAQPGGMAVTASWLMGIGAAGFSLLSIDALTGRALSGRIMRMRGIETVFERLAYAEQLTWIADEWNRRGFDDKGRPR